MRDLVERLLAETPDDMTYQTDATGQRVAILAVEVVDSGKIGLEARVIGGPANLEEAAKCLIDAGRAVIRFNEGRGGRLSQRTLTLRLEISEGRTL